MELNLNSIEREEKENPFISKFEQFFHLRYKKEIEKLASTYPEKKSLNIDFNELERFDFELAEELISNPDYLIDAAKEAVKSIDIPNLGLEIEFTPNIRFYNLPKDREVLLRNIGSEHLGKLISVEGVIRQITDVLPKLKLAVWECTKCGNTYKISQEGQSIKKPSICECKNKEFDLLEDKSFFIDYQKIQIQEPLEKLRGHEQPTTLNIYVSDDLVNKVSAGDKTRFVGVIRLLVPRERKVVYGRFLEAIHLDETEKEFSEVEVSKEEEEQIKELSKNPQIYDILVQSIAPNIYGHEIVKEAIALQLFGGVKKLLPNNTSIRGNIHLLIVGDPGMAKCVSGDTRILLEDGTQTRIDQFVEENLQKNQQFNLEDGVYSNINQFIPTINLDGKISEQKALRVYKRKAPKMYEIKTSTGKKIKGTYTHPLFSCENGKVKAVKISNLKKGDFIAIPRNIKINPAEILLNNEIIKGKTNAAQINLPLKVSKELARILAYIASESHIFDKTNSKYVSFTNVDKELLEDFFTCVKKIFNLNPKIKKREKITTIKLHSTELHNFLKLNAKEVLGKSRDKKIPAIIMNSNDNVVKEFLKAFINAEGSIRKDERGIAIVSASEELLEQLQTLLLRFGIVSSKKAIWNVATNTIKKEKRKYYRIRFAGQFAIDFINKIGFITKRKQEKAKKIILSNKKTNSNIDVIPNLNALLKEIRINLGISQFKTGIARTSFQHYERGDRLPSKKQLGKIVSTFLKEYEQKNLFDKNLEKKLLDLFKLWKSDIFWDKIEEVKEIPSDEWVYDIEVENSHIFITNNMFSHNSALLQATNEIAPKSIYVAGKTSSGVGLCVAPDSLILNDNGFKEIKEFVEENFDKTKSKEEISNAFSNDFCGKAPTLENNLKVTNSEIYKIWKIKAPERMIKIRTMSGKELDLTPNTSLVRIKNDSIEWIKASEITENDFIASSRILPEGEVKNYPTIKVLYGNKNIRIRDNVFTIFKEITDKLLKKYKSVKEIAKKLGISRERIYLWRTKNYSSGIPLHAFVSLGLEAGYSFEELSNHVTKIFLSYGKNVKIPRYIDDEEIAYLAGLVLGDGSIYLTKRSASIRVFNQSEEILKKVDSIVEKTIGAKTEKISDGVRVPNRRIASIPLYTILNAYGIVKEKNKIRISCIASEFSNKVVSKILQGLFDTDGYTAKTKKGSPHIGLRTISKDLAKTVLLCLLKFGIHTKLRLRKVAGRISIGKKITVKSNNNQWIVEIRGKENLEKFEEKIGFNLQRKSNSLREIISAISKSNTNIDVVPQIKETLKELSKTGYAINSTKNISRNKLIELVKKQKTKNNFLKNLSDSDIFWEKVTEKTEFKPEYDFVYDFSVKESHNFIANGIFVHNTASAVKDDFGEGGWTLKAGALVLASGGLALVDEFDKMECLTSDALITLEDGTLKPLKELFIESTLENEVENTVKGKSVKSLENFRVLSMDENGKIIGKKLLKVHEFPYSGKLLKITLESGETLKVTPNHPFFCLNEKSEIKTIKAGFLRKGIFLTLPRIINTFSSQKISNELARVYGYLAGDGNVSWNPNENYFIRFTNKETDLIEDFNECIHKIGFESKFFPSDSKENGVITQRVNGKKLVEEIQFNAPGLIEKYSNKYSPTDLVTSPSTSSNYLKGLFDSEGFVDIKNKQISFSSTSERLTIEVKSLLLRFGILSQIRVRKAEQNRKKSFILRITNQDSIQKFSTFISFTHNRKRKKLEEILQKEKCNRTIINVIPNIGDLLKEIRINLKLKQSECGLIKSTYNNFENNVANISIEKAALVLEKFKEASLKHENELVKEKIKTLETLIDSDLVWRKVKKIEITETSEAKELNHKMINELNKVLDMLRVNEKITKKTSFQELKNIVQKIERKISEIEKCKENSFETLTPLLNEIKLFNISEQEIALKLEVNQSTIHRWLNKEVKTEKLEEKISDAFYKILNSIDLNKVNKVIKKTKLYLEKEIKIYDLTVEDSHNFIANNIIVHNSEDRSAMHEAMEQGRVSVAKAGIVTSFKTDTSVLAAANPKYSRFDPYQSFLEQIDLPSTLISRFDLFFPIKDVLDRAKDKEIASHILETHKTGEMLIQSKLKGKNLSEEQSKELKKIIPIIDNELLKKFISFARQNVFPILEKESIQMISEFYIDLRDQGRKEGAYSATHRQLEGLVRLSEASARVRLSDKVELEDVKRAIKLVKYSLEELVTDPETGKIDIDILTAGITHTQISNLKSVLKIVKDLAETQEMVSIQEIIDQAKSEGIGEEEKIREYISTLKKKGELYEPRHNFLKPTSKK